MIFGILDFRTDLPTEYRELDLTSMAHLYNKTSEAHAFFWRFGSLFLLITPIIYLTNTNCSISSLTVSRGSVLSIAYV
jgi:hypothetical protein